MAVLEVSPQLSKEEQKVLAHKFLIKGAIKKLQYTNNEEDNNEEDEEEKEENNDENEEE
jgi:hypothetical protein